MFLLAMEEISRVVSRYYLRHSSLSHNWVLVCALLAVVGFWVGLVYWDRIRHRLLKLGRQPNSLFQELCTAHRLNRGQRMLLMKAAHSGRIHCASVMFVDRQILEKFAAGESDDASRYRELLVRLFGERPLPEE